MMDVVVTQQHRQRSKGESVPRPCVLPGPLYVELYAILTAHAPVGQPSCAQRSASITLKAAPTLAKPLPPTQPQLSDEERQPVVDVVVTQQHQQRSKGEILSEIRRLQVEMRFKIRSQLIRS